MEKWEKLFESEILRIATSDDPAHDHLHFKRVVRTAKHLAISEKAKMEVVVPAAWLHDIVIIPKNDPRRSQASRLSAKAALSYLDSIRYPSKYFEEIGHAIECHSFSANILPKSIEAKVVQDADRLDGLGAIGIARCFATAGLLRSSFYNPTDPFCRHRDNLNDERFAVDHFYKKLFSTAETLQTASGRQEGVVRLERMQRFLSDLAAEISHDERGDS